MTKRKGILRCHPEFISQPTLSRATAGTNAVKAACGRHSLQATAAGSILISEEA